MKKFYRSITFIIFAGIISLNSCSYDVTEPLWDAPYTEPAIPQIVSVVPAIATAGVNYITISGTDFLGVQDSAVYFGTTQTEVISTTQTEIVVRRPDVFGDSLEVKVIPSETLVAAKYTAPYQIDRVVYEYGEYILGTALDVVFTDDQNNLYVISNVAGARTIDKITPAGDKSTLAVQARRDITDPVVGPDGRVYLLADNRSIDAADLTTETMENNWLRLPQGQFAKTGVFDSEGYFYTGGETTPINIVDPDLNITGTTYYSEDIVWITRIFDNNLYVLVEAAAPDAQTPEWALWRHALLGSGTISDKELVFDLTMEEKFNNKTISTMEISEDGLILFSTDGDNPLVTYDITTAETDYFYKNILPTTINHFKWGTETDIYALVSDSLFIDPDYPDTDFTDRLFRIDVGISAAQ